MKFELIPHSSATNSYGLLEDVIDAIESEPRRFDWAEWIRRDVNIDFEDAPACGTQACVAGWTVLLTSSSAPSYGGSMSYHAERWFPEEVRFDLSHLFLATGDYFGSMMRQRDEGESQAAYAARGVASIRKFMSKHEPILRAHTIVIPARS